MPTKQDIKPQRPRPTEEWVESSIDLHGLKAFYEAVHASVPFEDDWWASFWEVLAEVCREKAVHIEEKWEGNPFDFNGPVAIWRRIAVTCDTRYNNRISRPKKKPMPFLDVKAVKACPLF